MTNSQYILIGIVALVVLVIMIYNRLVSLKQTVRNAFADVDVQMKQRYDLVPNLVSTVKGYAAHESEVFEKVTEARSQAMHAKTLADRGQAENALSGSLMQLMAVAENYPQLKANENFKQLQDELEDLENKIAASRRFFNNAVAEYNTSIGQFPAVLLAHMFNFAPESMFALGDRAVESVAPKVSF